MAENMIELKISIPESEYNFIKESEKRWGAEYSSKECMMWAIRNGEKLGLNVITVSHALKKGVMAARNIRLGGFDLLIVHLGREMESGKGFDLQDIEKTEAAIHFADRESAEITYKALDYILKNWREE